MGKESEKFYKEVNDTINWLGKIAFFIIVWFIVGTILNLTIYSNSNIYETNSDWVSFFITIILFVVLWSFKNKEQNISKKNRLNKMGNILHKFPTKKRR